MKLHARWLKKLWMECGTPVVVKGVEDVAEVEESLIFFVMRKLTRYPDNNNGNLLGAMSEKFSPKRILSIKTRSAGPSPNKWWWRLQPKNKNNNSISSPPSTPINTIVNVHTHTQAHIPTYTHIYIQPAPATSHHRRNWPSIGLRILSQLFLIDAFGYRGARHE